MQHIIFKQTSLLYNRHLDQVLLSAIYGICKVAQLKQISFKQIVNHYRRQPQAKSDIFRTVVLKQTDVELQVTHTCLQTLHHIMRTCCMLKSGVCTSSAMVHTSQWLLGCAHFPDCF